MNLTTSPKKRLFIPIAGALGALFLGIVLTCGLTACGKESPKEISTLPPSQGEPDMPGLPPDPGEEGMKTLLGVDVNNNSIRDDIERWIAKEYPNSAKIREGLMQQAKVYNLMLRDAGDKNLSRAHSMELEKVRSCGFYIGELNGKSVDQIIDVFSELHAQFLNTDERSLAYFAYDKQLEGGIYGDVPNDKAACDFDPETLAN